MLSPGTAFRTDEAGIMKQVIKEFGSNKSILGVCLGHQRIAEVFGAELFNIKMCCMVSRLKSKLKDKSNKLFRGLPESFRITHYHSWAVKPETINGELQVTAVNGDGLVMALAHKTYDVQGVQFHPESVMTDVWKSDYSNWLK